MRTNLLLILPLVLLASAAQPQPRTIGYLYEAGHVAAMGDVGGVLWYAEGNDLYRGAADHSYIDLFAGIAGKSEVVNLTDVNDILYFTENRPDATALWRVNEMDEIVQLVEFTNTFSQISPPTHVNGTVYFGFQDKLYRSDGTAAGTVLVTDLEPSGNQGLLRLWKAGNSLYMNFRKSETQHELWRSDGTATGSTLLDSFFYLEFLADAGDTLFFVADDGSSGRELWSVSDGAASMVSDINPGSGSSFSKEGNASASGNGLVVFSTSSPAGVWVTHTSTQQLAPVRASEIVYADGKFIFGSGNDLWVSDGTSAGTAMLKAFDDINPGYPRLSNLTGIGNSAFFAVDGMQLWQSDGTTAGTILLYDHTPWGTTPSGTMTLTTAGDQLYYFATFASNNEMAWQTDLLTFDPDDVWVPSLQLVDANTDEVIRMLGNPAVIFIDQPISIRADASLATSSVVFALNGENVRRENARPFLLAGDNSGNYNAWNIEPGVYELRVTPYTSTGAQGPSVVYNITVVSTFEGCGTGGLVREIWTGIAGNQVSLIPRDRRPTGTEMISSFEGPSNSGINFGARIKGYVCPPASGEYLFWISSNDHSELWLSTDENPANKVMIANVTAATNPRQWDKFTSQRSSPVHLQAGKQYYIEAWHKQGVGTDHVAVGWQLPGGEMERPIPSNRISPFTGNQPPEVWIATPTEGQVFTAPADILIRIETPDTDGFVTKVEIFAGDKLLDEWNHQFEWKNVPPGSYDLWARARDNDGAVVTSKRVNITVTGGCSASGTITREYWTNVSGSRVSDIPLGDSPTGAMELTSFEGPSNAGIHYGARIRGFICPPSSGDYVLYISSNDHSELWLSSGDDPANKVRIAWVTGATNPGQWNKFSSQASSPVRLEQGKKYYIEALHKQGVGSDHLAVGWRLPDGVLERPIQGNRLAPFGEAGARVSFMTYPSDGASDIDPMVMKLEVEGVIGARRYTVEINPDGDFSGTSMTIRSVVDYQTTFIIKGLGHSTTYNVRVKTDISGVGSVSQFTTRDPIGLYRLWGMTAAGGEDGLGTVFSFSIDSANFVKHHDQKIVRYVYGEGEEDYVEYEEMLIGTPVAGPDGTLYGQSDHVYSGNLFVMDKDGQLRWLDPTLYINEGNIMLGSDNAMYVTTAPGLEGGGIDRYHLEDSQFANDLRIFNQREFGWDPRATLIELPDGYLYGTTREGGLNNGGVVYRTRLNGSAFEIIHYFDTDYGGMNPFAGLTEADGFLYGTTSSGGIAGGHGTLFRIRPDGSDFEKLHDFDGWNGRQPRGELLVQDGMVYGMTTEGGASNDGVVFRINVDGTAFSILHEFSGDDGAGPSGSLALGPDEEALYGMTSGGGENDMGVIFEVSRNGTGFDKLYDFSQWSGGRPEGSLIIREDTFSPPSAMARMAAVEEMQLSIHPNPSADNFNVHVDAPGGERIQLVVTDQYGQAVMTCELTNGTAVQVGSELQRGLYIMKIVQGKRTMMKRVVKK